MPPSQRNVKNDFTADCRAALVFMVSLVVIGLLNNAYLNMPPVWDVAAGTFAPAIYLYENSFDILSLLNQPGYMDAGPNVHSLGLVTILTWSVIKLTAGESQLYLPVLHLVQFVFSAFVLTMTYKMARRLFDNVLAVGITVLLGFFPVFLVQTSYLYTEIAGALLFLLWVNAWASGHYRRMMVYAILACTVKGIGLVLVPVQVLLLTVDSSLSIRRRVAAMTASVSIPVVLKVFEKSLTASTSFAGPGEIKVRPVFDNLLQVPDLLALVMLSLAFPLVCLVRETLCAKNWLLDSMTTMSTGDYCGRLWLGIMLTPPVFMLFLISVPLTGYDFFPLPRYYVWILPFMLLILGRTLMALPPLVFSRQNQAALILLLFIGFSISNRNGNFYPAGLAPTSFSISERSFEYVDYYRAQQAGVRAVAKMARGVPVIVTRGEYYFLSNPLMGYVDKKVENIKFVLLPPYNSGRLTDYPEKFFILDTSSNRYHGIHLIKSIVEQASTDKKYLVETIENYRHGPYFSTLFRVGPAIER